MILNDAEIEADMQVRINTAWPPAAREKAIRLGGQMLVDLNAFFESMTQVKSKIILDRDAEIVARENELAEIAALQATEDPLMTQGIGYDVQKV